MRPVTNGELIEAARERGRSWANEDAGLLRFLADALERAEKERDDAREGERGVWISLQDVGAERDRLRAENEKLREELMRCGSLAVSSRIDGSLGKRAALQIREIAHRAWWPSDDEAELRREAEMPC